MCRSTGRLQCLQITVSRIVSLGLPLGNVARVFSSISGSIGDAEPREPAAGGAVALVPSTQSNV